MLSKILSNHISASTKVSPINLLLSSTPSVVWKHYHKPTAPQEQSPGLDTSPLNQTSQTSPSLRILTLGSLSDWTLISPEQCIHYLTLRSGIHSYVTFWERPSLINEVILAWLITHTHKSVCHKVPPSFMYFICNIMKTIQPFILMKSSCRSHHLL